MQATLETIEREIQAQHNDLPNLSLHFGEPIAKEKLVLCGCGDSYGCALFWERLTNFAIRAMDPSDVLHSPESVIDKTVCFVSISGRTKSNVLAARSIREKANRTIALTANPESELAKACKETIIIPFTKLDGQTPGTNSFTASLIACEAIFRHNPLSLRKTEVESLLERAKTWSSTLDQPFRRYHFIGSGPMLGIALYGAAKIFEFTGLPADYQLTEEFAHLNLFSLSEEEGSEKEEMSVILRYGPDDQPALKLDRLLNESGFRSVLLPIAENENDILRLAISYSIHLQYIGLKRAQSLSLKEPSFQVKKSLLRISNAMIY